MYGIGIGIVLAIVYWVMLSVSGALGAGGVLLADAGCLGAEYPVRCGGRVRHADRANLTGRSRQSTRNAPITTINAELAEFADNQTIPTAFFVSP